MTRGGKRKGAGRPPGRTLDMQLNVGCRGEQKARWLLAADTSGDGLGEWVRAALDAAAEEVLGESPGSE